MFTASAQVLRSSGPGVVICGADRAARCGHPRTPHALLPHLQDVWIDTGPRVLVEGTPACLAQSINQPPSQATCHRGGDGTHDRRMDHLDQSLGPFAVVPDGATSTSIRSRSLGIPAPSPRRPASAIARRTMAIADSNRSVGCFVMTPTHRRRTRRSCRGDRCRAPRSAPRRARSAVMPRRLPVMPNFILSAWSATFSLALFVSSSIDACRHRACHRATTASSMSERAHARCAPRSELQTSP